ncbi:MAG: hypothetical protein J7497_16690, partial [Chitinophagaceae bacterium]|nr:hypothetical protein [Chitinophagaceae bacterium]
FNQGFYYLGYIVQQKEYMKQCVNKARPQMHCNGKCLLMKKIEEQEKKERAQAPEMKYAAKQEVFSSSSSFNFSFAFHTSDNHLKVYPFNTGIPVDRTSPVFRPPSILS